MGRTELALLFVVLVALPLVARAEEPVTPTVTVTAKKEPVVKKIDKTVYDVSNMPRAANGTAQDVLQSTPEISVSNDGRISVKGNSQVTVLVDGKPTAMMSGGDQAVALQTMSGADIASVEVITNPSAAYNANGGAILNIVLKRNRKPGTHAQVRGSATDQSLWNAGASGDMTGKDLSLHGNLAMRRDGTLKRRESAVDWNNPFGGPSVQTRQTSEVFVRRTVKSASLGLDYTLSDSDSLSAAARYNERGSRPLFDVLNDNRTGTSNTIYHRISSGPNEQSDGSASLSYSHQAEGTALKAALQHSDTIGLIDKSYRDVFVAPALATDYSHGATRSARHLSQATVDWTRASEYGQWGMGLDIQAKTDDIDNYQADVEPLTGAETPDANTTNRYAVRTTSTAGYLTKLIRAGKWEALFGGRAERVALRVRSAQGGMPTDHWLACNPSFHLRYAYSDKADLTLNYRRSLQMPDPRDLNPFTTYIDSQNQSRGNPALQPQYLTSWEAGTNIEVRKVTGNLGVFYRSSRDTVTDARSIGAENVLITSKLNGGQAHSAGITGSLDWKPDAKFTVGMDAGVYRVVLKTLDLDRVVHEDRVAGYLNFRTSYSAAKDELSLDAHGQSAGITPLGRYGATSSVNLSWKRQLSMTASLTVDANDIFDGSRRTYATASSTYRQAGFDHFITRRIYVGLVKKFN